MFLGLYVHAAVLLLTCCFTKITCTSLLDEQMVFRTKQMNDKIPTQLISDFL